MAMRFQKSEDTKILEHLLAQAVVGQVVSYPEMSRAIGRDVRKFARPSLDSARRFLLNEKRMVFGSITNVGFKRLADTEIVVSTESDRLKMARCAGRTIRKLECVNFEGLTDEDRKKHITASAQVGAIAMFAKKTSQKTIEKKVVDTGKTLAIGETLSLFSK